MTKTKYEVYKNGRLLTTYVTTIKNCEDMLQTIRYMHEVEMSNIYQRSGFKIIRIIGDKRDVIYTPKNSTFWDTPFDIN